MKARPVEPSRIMGGHAALAELERCWKACPSCAVKPGRVHDRHCPVSSMMFAIDEANSVMQRALEAREEAIEIHDRLMSEVRAKESAMLQRFQDRNFESFRSFHEVRKHLQNADMALRHLAIAATSPGEKVP